MDPKYLSVQEELEKLKIISSNHSNSAAKDVKEASTDGPKDEVADGSLFNMFKIECTADQGQFCFKQFTIDGYPSLLLFENGKMKMEFPGPNESNDLKKFILNSINSYQKGLSKKTDNQRTKPSIIPVHDTTKQPKDKPPILTIQDQKKNMYQKALESDPHDKVSKSNNYSSDPITVIASTKPIHWSFLAFIFILAVLILYAVFSILSNKFKRKKSLKYCRVSSLED